MAEFSTKSLIHSRLSHFVEWIAPEDSTEDAIKAQADEIRDRIKARATEDKLTVVSMPYSGSYQKNNGLRRHYLGDSEVEGQDVDIAFIVKRKDTDGKELNELINRFQGYAKASYPKTKISITKSSVVMQFAGTKLNYDIVPLLETTIPDRQELIRTTGERRTTSVVKHAEFTRKRTDASNQLKGIVKFNDCSRLIKWWRYFKQDTSGVFGNGDNDRKVPSFLLDMLCAKAYDERKVQTTWAHTLADWFGFMAHIVRNKETVVFYDYVKNSVLPTGARWLVADPLDPSNNIVKNWQDFHISEFATWLEDARDIMNRALVQDEDGDDGACMESLVELFGNPFKLNSEE